ncbi:Hypothetical protein CINCED_3A011633, partial [Cinara cedri]
MDDIPYIDDDGAINDFNCIPGDMNYGSKNDYDVEIPVKTGVDMEKKPSHEQLKLQEIVCTDNGNYMKTYLKYESKICKEITGMIGTPMENNILKSPLDKPVFDTQDKHK